MATQEELDREIAVLIKEYVSLISGDHHKHKDGVFTIDRTFDGFSEEAYWYAFHPGYIFEFGEQFPTYEAAAEFMKTELRSMIEKAKQWPKEPE